MSSEIRGNRKLRTSMPDQAAYRPIGDYGLIGDMQSAALVASDGSIDWCCWPRFDSPAVFCRLLDSNRGGFFRIGPTERSDKKRAYLSDSNVLQTRFKTEYGCVELTDLMPIDVEPNAAGRRIIRQIEGLEGEVELEVKFRPTFDFARATGTIFEIGTAGVVAKCNSESISLAAPIELVANDHGEAAARFRVAAGQRYHFVLTYTESGAPASPSLNLSKIEKAIGRTVETWRNWASACTYDGPYRNLVRRSALTLKLLTHSPTGALVAAPTTSLPEEIGGLRNWDYRFTWLRDSADILFALQTIGYHDEAQQFWDWLSKLCVTCGDTLRPMYTVHGESPLPECTLDHLEGYRGSRPVRIGNAAAAQRQLDVYGNVLDAAHFCIAKMGMPERRVLAVLDHFALEAANSWAEPDFGIWEARKEPQHYLHSKLLCWVALDRAIKLKRGSGSFEQIREKIRSTILREGYNQELGAFTQTLGSAALDASALLVPILGLLPVTDARVRSTTRLIKERLTSNGLVYRYLNPDGLPGTEGTFALCSFWLVDNLALAGELNEACDLFERLIGYANELGLLSEEINPMTGELLGNFPQGFTHLALIRSALHIAGAKAFGAEVSPRTPAERADMLSEANIHER